MGYAELDLPLWFGLYAPARVPAALVEQLNRQLVQALAAPDLAEALMARGFDPRPGPAKELEAITRREFSLYAKVIADAGIKLQ